MILEVQGKVVNTDEQGYLMAPNVWGECVVEVVAESQGMELTETHWGQINYFSPL